MLENYYLARTVVCGFIYLFITKTRHLITTVYFNYILDIYTLFY